MKKGEYLTAILRSPMTVFTSTDLALLWGDSGNAARVRASYYCRKGDLYRLRRGLYAKSKDYDVFEMATKIFSPSYVSFETVLARSGVTFQYYGQIFIASYLTRTVEVDGVKVESRKIKDAILTDKTGIEQRAGYAIATPERAFLDVVYLNPNYYFDILGSLDWRKVKEILPIYDSRRMEKSVRRYERRQQQEKLTD